MAITTKIIIVGLIVFVTKALAGKEVFIRHYSSASDSVLSIKYQKQNIAG